MTKKLWVLNRMHYAVPVMTLFLFLPGCGGKSKDLPAASGTPPREAGSDTQGTNDLVSPRLPSQLPTPDVPRAVRSGDWFIDVASSVGLDFSYHDASESGFYQLIESVGGGVACFDYDNDGDIDLLFSGGGELSGKPIEISGRPLGLFRNDSGTFTNVTQSAALSPLDFYSHGCTVADYDCDGFADLFVAGYHGCVLYQNQQDGTFRNVTEPVGLALHRWGTAAAWADVNNDSWLDLYQVTYAKWEPDHTRKCTNDQGLHDICGPTLFPGDQDILWLGSGDGKFSDGTTAAGLVTENRGLGVVAIDFDSNKSIDFFVANDVHANQLYEGDGNGLFEQVGEISGVAFSATGEREGSMGLDVGDFDRDGLPDLWYANYASQDNSLLIKTDGPGFVNVTAVVGLLGRSRPWVGFGTTLTDFDSDGWLDIFVVNGHVAYDRLDGPYFQPAQLFRNVAGERLEEVSDEGGSYFSVPHAGRGAASVDYNDDGAADLVVVHQNAPVALLQNQKTPAAWVRLKLHGTRSNRDAIGAKVTIHNNDQDVTRWICGGSGYLSHFDPRILVALAADTVVEATVTWPNGTRETFTQLTTGRTHALVEGMGR